MTAAPPPDSDSSADPYAKVRRVWLWSQVISSLGSAMVWLASSYIIFDQSRSVAVTALISASWSLPPLLLPGVATALVNRFGGPRTFMARYLASAVLAVIPVILVLTGHLGTTSLLLWSLLMSTSAGLFSPSATIVKTMLAPRSMSSDFNADVARAAALASVLGTLLGGVVLTAFGPLWIFVFNSISYLAPALSVVPLLRTAVPHALTRERFRSIIGLLFGPSARRDLHAACIFTSVGILIGGYTVTLPAIARSVGTSPNLLALLQIAAAFGGLLTVRAIRLLHGRVQWGTVQRGCLAAMGIGVLVVAWASRIRDEPALTLALSTVAVLAIGFAFNLDQTILNSAVQLSTPKESQAVFFTYYALIPLVVEPASQAVIGVVADRWSVSVALAILGVLTLMLVTLGPHLQIRTAFDTMSDADNPPAAK